MCLEWLTSWACRHTEIERRKRNEKKNKRMILSHKIHWLLFEHYYCRWAVFSSSLFCSRHSSNINCEDRGDFEIGDMKRCGEFIRTKIFYYDNDFCLVCNENKLHTYCLWVILIYCNGIGEYFLLVCRAFFFWTKRTKKQ